VGGLGSGIVKAITLYKGKPLRTEGYDPCNDRICCLVSKSKRPLQSLPYLVYDRNDTITMSVSLRSVSQGRT
jgi:hypothetical protein